MSHSFWHRETKNLVQQNKFEINMYFAHTLKEKWTRWDKKQKREKSGSGISNKIESLPCVIVIKRGFFYLATFLFFSSYTSLIIYEKFINRFFFVTLQIHWCNSDFSYHLFHCHRFDVSGLQGEIAMNCGTNWEE